MEAPSCRFCFEEETRMNKLLSPCDCQGSIRFVHVKCLLHWQRVAPIQFIHKCQLCLTYFKNGILVFERLPNERGFIYQFLICPYMFTFVAKYGFFLFSFILMNSEQGSRRLIEYFQCFVHLLYFFFFIQTAQINNTSLYLKSYFKPYRVLVYLLHFSSIFYTLETGSFFFLYLVDVFLPCYWHFHLRSLEEVNARLELD